MKYALYTDESGGAGELVRAMAGVAGPVAELAALERALASAAARHGVRDLKWAQVRTRPNRLAAAREYMDLARAARAKGAIWLGATVWTGAEAGPRSRRSEPLGRLAGHYARLLQRATRQFGRGDWAFYPDQRTGMDWAGVLRAAQGRGRPRFKAWCMLPSAHCHLIQLADLCAGMLRQARDEAESLAAWAAGGREDLIPARRNRYSLLHEHLPTLRPRKRHDR